MNAKSLLLTTALLMTVILLTAMGGSGGFDRAPRVEKNYSVTITDRSGSTITGEKFSWEGRIQFAGFMGLAQVVMPFDKIRDIVVGEQHEQKIRITAHLADGTEVVFDVEAKSKCFGEASFGSFMLRLDEIKTIVFTKHN